MDSYRLEVEQINMQYGNSRLITVGEDRLKQIRMNEDGLRDIKIDYRLIKTSQSAGVTNHESNLQIRLLTTWW